MTKKQMHQEINSKFYQMVESKFPQYIIDDNEGGGRVYLINMEEKNEEYGCHDSIEYHMSRHTVCAYNDVSEACFSHEKIMKYFLEKLVAEYDL